MKALHILGGAVVLAALAATYEKSHAATKPVSVSTQAGARYQLTAPQVYGIARDITRRHYPRVSPLMLTAMAQIESSFMPTAVRTEPHIRNRYTNNGDASIGLLQTLFTTALWLNEEMGARDYGLVNADSLLDPQTSVYYGASYVDWLRRYRGQPRGEKWIVMSYNGGAGADNKMTRNHWRKYEEAKDSLQREFGWTW